jgi:hypothetical protein
VATLQVDANVLLPVGDFVMGMDKMSSCRRGALMMDTDKMSFSRSRRGGLPAGICRDTQGVVEYPQSTCHTPARRMENQSFKIDPGTSCPHSTPGTSCLPRRRRSAESSRDFFF